MELNREEASRYEQPERSAPEWLEVVGKQVASIRFGVVQIVIHDSRVVQIERTEKVRLADGSQRAVSTV